MFIFGGALGIAPVYKWYKRQLAGKDSQWGDSRIDPYQLSQNYKFSNKYTPKYK